MEILVEMVVTAMRSATVSLNMAGEKAVAAALTAVDLLKSVTDVVDTVDADLIEEASRLAKEREAEAAENDYSEEDKEQLNKMRQQAAADEMARRMEAAFAEKEAEQKKREKEEEEDLRAVREEGGSEDLQQARLEKRRTDRELADLKGKIQKLQVQLRVQHVQALQSMNLETRALQVKIQRQLNLSHKKTQDRALSLVADFIDASVHALRTETEAYVEQMFGSESARGFEKGLSGILQMQTDLSSKVRAHLGWMLALNPFACLFKPCDLAPANNFSSLGKEGEGEGGGDDEKKHSQEQQESSKDVSTKYLALLPDARSRALWLSSIVDETRVRGMVEKELQQKLGFLDSACMNELAQKFSGKRKLFSETFCSLVLDGLRGINRSHVDLPLGDGAEAAEAK